MRERWLERQRILDGKRDALNSTLDIIGQWHLCIGFLNSGQAECDELHVVFRKERVKLVAEGISVYIWNLS